MVSFDKRVQNNEKELCNRRKYGSYLTILKMRVPIFECSPMYGGSSKIIMASCIDITCSLYYTFFMKIPGFTF